MAKDIVNANAKIHVLADETLGGIKREYVEVDRKAGVDEKIVIVDKEDDDEGYKIGAVFTVDRSHHTLDGDVYSDAASSDTNYNGLIYREEYHVLEPTDIVHIDGERYALTDRKAEVGEKVMYVNESGESYGIVTEVIAVGAGVVDVAEYEEPSGAVVVGFSHDRYRVLVPVETAESDEPKPADPIDVIANLAQEVAELKRKVSALETTVERHERVNDRHRDEIDTLYKDKRTLGEELARLKYPAKNESIIESAPFVLVIHGGRGEFDVYQRGKKIENISRLEIEADSRIGSSIDLEFNNVGERP
ncbi:hypothetical protein [Bacillus velezensis]|uniref:hypothetical protein n=1 Tax=Bacillus velezensis TaxID=492670 RepID=UPI001F3C3FD9|nr:hypothetical protein [Bacillus velezensis]MCE4941085.1 hypothetical protein [Bacillus velezensis]